MPSAQAAVIGCGLLGVEWGGPSESALQHGTFRETGGLLL